MLDIRLKPIVRQATFFIPTLQVGHLVRFSQRWPERVGIKPGATYEITQAQQIFFPIPYIIPEIGTALDYKDIDLSNLEGAERLFPATSLELYDAFLGLKEGNYFIQLHSPQNQFIYTLSYTGMFYDIADTKKRYIGAIYPYQSPADDPRIRLFFVYNQTPFFIRLHVEDEDYDKAVLVFYVNRCYLKEIPVPTPEQKEKALYIPHLDEVALRVRI